MNEARGFSLVEMLIVVAIIGILASVSIPLLRKAKNSADSGSAVATIRTLVTAERLYQLKHNNYTDLTGLVPEGTLDTTIRSGTKSGYAFTITLSATMDNFSVIADPLDADPSLGHFYVDETAVIRTNLGATDPSDTTTWPAI